ncbi:helix-turn-helix domain-containing protein [Neobacillus drentensis]|uniref:helix-turn-helix domain-containing protein n=1 Tax=Neobacillus drentensis TaxID=220684 RepID=UPI00285AEB2B|nr:helix-turn-helix transcriptional regulator [Neobacillus drentensis]MDR7237174.1 transcriptional regulator with XRE-family HTH domain [Neobacillus drentensis]
MSELSRLLKDLRGDRSLREVAEITGLSHSYIADIEKGFRRGSNNPINPSPDTLRRLAKAYLYDYDELLKVAGYLEDGSTSSNEVEELPPEVRTLARDWKTILPTDKELLKGIIKQMSERGKKAKDE